MNHLRDIRERLGLIVQVAIVCVILLIIGEDKSIGGDPGAASVME